MLRVNRVPRFLFRPFSTPSPWGGPLPPGPAGRVLRRLLAAGQGQARTEQKEWREDPLLPGVLEGLAQEGWRAGEHPGQPFCSFWREAGPYRLEIYLEYPAQRYEDWLGHKSLEEKKEQMAMLEKSGVQVSLQGAVVNPLDQMLVKEQLEQEHRDTDRQILKRVDAPTLDFYAVLSKGEGALGLRGLSVETQLVYEELHLLPSPATPLHSQRLKRDTYLGPQYHQLNSNVKLAVHELYIAAGLRGGVFPRLQYAAERAESLEFVRWTHKLTHRLYSSHPNT